MKTSFSSYVGSSVCGSSKNYAKTSIWDYVKRSVVRAVETSTNVSLAAWPEHVHQDGLVGDIGYLVTNSVRIRS